MHDVTDLRDVIPDEAEQLRLSGYEVADLERAARDAAARSDLAALRAIEERLAAAPRSPGWVFDEPDDDATLAAAAERAPVTTPDADRLADQIRGAWLGRAVANTMGKPIEGLTRAQVEIYLRAGGQWPQTGYVPLLDPLPAGVDALHPSAPVACAGTFTDVPRDDDIDWTILGVHMLAKHGRDITTEAIAAEWLDRVPFTQTYTAERAAYRNLTAGVRPPETATLRNPYREWIGALIRADAFGYVSPGDPGAAARLAARDAALSHTANGVYGEVWAAALVAQAFVEPDAAAAIRVALGVVPATSRLAEAVNGVLDAHEEGAGYEEALDRIDARWGDYPWVHTVNNAALIATGLLWGTDFVTSVAITLAGGRDTDSNGATVGSVFGAMHGSAAIPDTLVGTTHRRVRSAVRDYDGITIDELAERTLALVSPTA